MLITASNDDKLLLRTLGKLAEFIESEDKENIVSCVDCGKRMIFM